MYNRYIPQSDGSYRRRSMPEPVPRPTQPYQAPPPPAEEPCAEPQSEGCAGCPHREPPRREPQQEPEGFGFLRQLLPGNFNAEDLLILLLLLLMSADCREERNLPLLTLALYLFL